MKWAVLAAGVASAAYAQEAALPDGGVSAATIRMAEGKPGSLPAAAQQQQQAPKTATNVQGRAATTPTAAAEKQPGTTPAPQAAAQPAAPAAQPVVVDRTAEVNALREQLQALRTEAQTTNERLQAAVSELQQVKQQLAQAQQSSSQQQSQRTSQRETAVTIGAVDQQLATGNTPTDAQLQALGANLGPSGRANIEYARTALQNGDVSSARMFLSQAAADAQAGR